MSTQGDLRGAAEKSSETGHLDPDAARSGTPSGRGPGRLQAQVVRRSRLSAAQRAEMLALMQHCYTGVEPQRFFADLDAKAHVILLTAARGGRLAGFSTIRMARATCAGRPVDVLFSGDTVIHPDFWGQKALQQAFLTFAIGQRLRAPHRPLYWLLLTKGYRTYLLLTNHFPRAFPRYDADLRPEERALAGALAAAWWPDAWDPTRGVLHFPGGHDRVAVGVAPLEGAVADNPHVRFFCAANPGHADGDELVCLAELRLRDMARSLARVARTRLGGRSGHAH